MSENYPILEFDPARAAVIDPCQVYKPLAMPPHCIICFYSDLMASWIAIHPCRELEPLRSNMGLHRIYEVEFQGQKLTIFLGGIGGPLAVALTEEMIARGARKFIAMGGAGVLDAKLPCGQLMIPTAALRDEGTSYHYLPPSSEVAAGAGPVAAIEAVLKNQNVPYCLGKTWTTDAFYRETPSRVAKRKAQGCLTVEMEAASLFALAQFRNVQLGQILYCSDDVSGTSWDTRNDHEKVVTLERALDLAAMACLSL